MTPSELAAELGVPTRRVRAWLRQEWPRLDANGRWDLTDAQVRLVRARFGAQAPSSRASGPRARAVPSRSRRDSDEAYVMDLVEAALGVVGARQHRFDWLRGDPNGRGVRAALPVDGYWPDFRLVVEYRERQHDEANALFDHRATISGGDRGAQRRRYDQLRDALIPAHQLRLVVIMPTDLASDRRGRLHRNWDSDTAAVRELLVASGVLPA
jgi:hypothetical protein